jgi:hypothetical protein
MGHSDESVPLYSGKIFLSNLSNSKSAEVSHPRQTPPSALRPPLPSARRGADWRRWGGGSGDGGAGGGGQDRQAGAGVPGGQPADHPVWSDISKPANHRLLGNSYIIVVLNSRLIGLPSSPSSPPASSPSSSVRHYRLKHTVQPHNTPIDTVYLKTAFITFVSSARAASTHAPSSSVRPRATVVGRGHVSLWTHLDTWHSKLVWGIGYL